MSLLLISFLAGMLSVLAPCVLPVLPVILGGSLGAQKRYRPLVIVLSTAIFIVLFTIVLKVSTALIGVPQSFWTLFSATIIIVYGVTLVRPQLRDRISAKIGLTNASVLATKAKSRSGIRGDILLGASLGPIFASCSPTYAILLSVVFPQSTTAGILYTLVYALGFALLLGVFAYGGRAIIKKFSGLSNPHGRFKKVLGILLISTGILIATGLMKKIEIALVNIDYLNVTSIEQKLLETMPSSSQPSAEPGLGQGIPAEMADMHPGAQFLNANYPAPDIAGLDNRINGGNYQSLKELKGKVVVLDFWTYSCINCIRTLDALKTLHATYADKGLVIVGIHAPEFQFEKDIKNVQKAVEEYGLEYPVVQDNDFKTRQNYNNRYRPAKYIIDKEGVIRYTHFGEGGYEETEQVIQYLLGVHNEGVLTDEVANYMPDQTPETYLGSLRAQPGMGGYAATSELNRWRLASNWSQTPEHIVLKSSTGSLFMNVFASQINLVMGNAVGTTTAQVYIDGALYKTLTVKDKTLYNLWKADSYGTHRLEIRFVGEGVEAYAFTFG